MLKCSRVSQSVKHHAVPPVHQVLEDTPSYNVTQTLPYYARSDSSEIAYKTVVLINLNDCFRNALIMLSLVFIESLEENSCSYYV